MSHNRMRPVGRALLVALLILVAGIQNAESYTIITLDGNAYETGAFPPSQSGDVLTFLGVLTDVSPPLTWDSSLYQYTWRIRNLTSEGEVSDGVQSVITFSGGEFQIYVDDFAPIGTQATYGTNPPNATAPSTFVDATADPNYLHGTFSKFEIVYNTITGQGAWSGDLRFDSGSFVNAVGTEDCYHITAAIGAEGVDGYAPAGSGAVNFDSPSCGATTIHAANPYPLVKRAPGPIGLDMLLEKRLSPPASEGLTLGFEIPSEFLCGGQGASAIKLFPRSGTGPVFSVSPMSLTTYFQMNNLTSIGYYDLEIRCADNSRDTLRTDVRYVGYLGYQSAGTLTNALTGNVIRGAGVTIWRDVGGGAFELYDGLVATDGTYAFDVPSGTYKVLVEYELDGEQWRGPFVVNSPIPYEDIALQPVTQDASAPVHVQTAQGGACESGLFIDLGVGISVLEPVDGSVQNLSIAIEQFVNGDDSVTYAAFPLDPDITGSATLRCMDQLGNKTERSVVCSATGVDVVAGVTPALFVLPNPSTAAGVQFRYPAGGSGETRIDIIDAAGRLVRTLSTFESRGAIAWDGADDRGQAVAAGTYFAILRSGRERAATKMTLVR